MLECFDEDFWKMTGGFFVIIAAGIAGFLVTDYMNQNPEVVQAAVEALSQFWR